MSKFLVIEDVREGGGIVIAKDSIIDGELISPEKMPNGITPSPYVMALGRKVLIRDLELVGDDAAAIIMIRDMQVTTKKNWFTPINIWMGISLLLGLIDLILILKK